MFSKSQQEDQVEDVNIEWVSRYISAYCIWLRSSDRSKSRNKVSVGEPAEGSLVFFPSLGDPRAPVSSSCWGTRLLA